MVEKTEIILVLDNIRSLYNVGSMFRTADGFGVKEIFLCGITGTPMQNGLKKVALGAEDNVPWKHVKQTWRIIRRLQADGYAVVGLEKTEGSQELADLSVPRRVVLVVGNEVNGITDTLLRRMDHVAHISMYGIKKSFNVSVACGIALHHLRMAPDPSQNH